VPARTGSWDPTASGRALSQSRAPSPHESFGDAPSRPGLRPPGIASREQAAEPALLHLRQRTAVLAPATRRPVLVHSGSPGRPASGARVLGGAEEPLLLVTSDRANPDVRMHMQLHADDGYARDPGGSPFACDSGCARRRERRAVGDRPLREPQTARSGVSRFCFGRKRS